MEKEHEPIDVQQKESGAIHIDPSYIGIVGLFFSSFGALFSVLSLTAGNGREIGVISGTEYHYALMNDFAFKLGFFFIVIGFILQIMEKAYSLKKKEVTIRTIIDTVVLSTIIYFISIYLVSRLFFL